MAVSRSPEPVVSGKRNNHPDTVATRTAVHEAGHTILAWFSTTVHEIKFVTIIPANGRAGYVAMTASVDTVQDAWCNLVVALGGLAAEVTIFRSFQSGVAKTDLLGARDLARLLIANQRTTPPWNNNPTSKMNFHKMFVEPLSTAEQDILQAGYQQARYLLERLIKDHHRLVVYLLEHRTAEEEDLERMFGNRSFIRALASFGTTTFLEP